MTNLFQTLLQWAVLVPVFVLDRAITRFERVVTLDDLGPILSSMSQEGALEAAGV